MPTMGDTRAHPLAALTKAHAARPKKKLVTVLSDADVSRAYYHCDQCGDGVIPKVVGTCFSPGVRRMMGQVGGKEAFHEGRKDLEALAGVRVTTKSVERVSEAIGEQM